MSARISKSFTDVSWQQFCLKCKHLLYYRQSLDTVVTGFVSGQPKRTPVESWDSSSWKRCEDFFSLQARGTENNIHAGCFTRPRRWRKSKSKLRRRTTCATGNTRGDVRSHVKSLTWRGGRRVFRQSLVDCVYKPLHLAPMWKQFTHGEDVGRCPGDGASEASLTVAQVFTVAAARCENDCQRGWPLLRKPVGWLAGAHEDCVTLSHVRTRAPPNNERNGVGEAGGRICCWTAFTF